MHLNGSSTTEGFVVAYEHHHRPHPRIPSVAISFWRGPPGTRLGGVDDAAVFTSEEEAKRSLTATLGTLAESRRLQILAMSDAEERWRRQLEDGAPVIVVGEFGGGWFRRPG